MSAQISLLTFNNPDSHKDPQLSPFPFYLNCPLASFDPVQNTWRRLADMQEFRSNFSVVVHKEHLYAIGGDKEINTNIDSVEMYNPDTDSWR